MSLDAFLWVVVLLVAFGWIPFLVVAVLRGRRPRTGYGRQLLASERGRGRRPRRRSRHAPGITISLDTRPPGLHKEEP